MIINKGEIKMRFVGHSLILNGEIASSLPVFVLYTTVPLTLALLLGLIAIGLKSK